MYPVESAYKKFVRNKVRPQSSMWKYTWHTSLQHFSPCIYVMLRQNSPNHKETMMEAHLIGGHVTVELSREDIEMAYWNSDGAFFNPNYHVGRTSYQSCTISTSILFYSV